VVICQDSSSPTRSLLSATLDIHCVPVNASQSDAKGIPRKNSDLSNFIDCFIGSDALLLGDFLYEPVYPMTPFILQLAIMVATTAATLVLIKETETKQE